MSSNTDKFIISEVSRDLQDIQLTQKENLLERKYLTGSMSLSTPNNTFRTCGAPQASSSTTCVLRNVV